MVESRVRQKWQGFSSAPGVLDDMGSSTPMQSLYDRFCALPAGLDILRRFFVVRIR
jgi:hypothetical protein